MVGLISRFEGRRFLLFHVEQLKGWQCRWRLEGDFPEPYLQWRAVETAEDWFIEFQSEAEKAHVVAEWRPDEESEWQAVFFAKVATDLRARFRVTAREGSLSVPFEEHAFMAMREPFGVARYLWRGGLSLAPGESMEIEGRADAPVLANVLPEAGAFRMWDPRLEVENLTATDAWWVEEEPCALGVLDCGRASLYATGPVAEPED